MIRTIIFDFYNVVYDYGIVYRIEELIKSLKNQGYKVMLLSNSIRSYMERTYKNLKLNLLFDEMVFSSDCGFAKPDKEVFEYVIDKFDLVPSECLFIDDKQSNILGAESVGMKGHVFEGYEKLAYFLKEIDVKY